MVSISQCWGNYFTMTIIYNKVFKLQQYYSCIESANANMPMSFLVWQANGQY